MRYVFAVLLAFLLVACASKKDASNKNATDNVPSSVSARLAESLKGVSSDFAKEVREKVVKTELKKTPKNSGFVYIKDSTNIRVGASGVVVQQIKAATSIVSSVRVVEKSGGLAKLQLLPFTMLAQDALPELDVSVKNGDEVIVNFLYDRVLLIAPDKATYDAVKLGFAELSFTHPDIFGAFLVRDLSLSPKKRHFANFCSNNALGIVAFVLKNRLQIADCSSLSPLLSVKFNGESKNPQTPFYSNIKEYSKNFLNFTEKPIKNYYNYYEALLKNAKSKK